MSTENKFTPGPWRWEINLKANEMHLSGGVPKHDLYILGFKRWGMSGARATVREEDGNMVDVDSLASLIPDREHHAAWLQTAHHPDLDLIAAAPDLLAALEIAKKELEDLWSFYGKGLEVQNWHLNGDMIPLDTFFEDNNSNATEVIDKAIAKAKGEL